MPISLLFPRKCLGCGQSGDHYFCFSCLNLVFLKNERICPICNQFSWGGKTHSGCQKPRGIDGLTSIFVYRGIMQKAIKKLKYKFIRDLGSDLVELFLSFAGEDKAFRRFCQQKNVFLVPIPLHSARLRWRGFNQAELLGKMISVNLALPFLPELLVRIKKTQSQARLTKDESQRNIKNAFKINPRSQFLIPDSRFIIFDDFWFSGNTLREAAKVLKRRGAKQVWGLTLAR